jgi:hypothetical protein
MKKRKTTLSFLPVFTVSTTAILAVTAFMPSEARAASTNAEFNYATIVGSGDTIHVDRVPVVGPTGSVVYKDLLITYKGIIDSSGNPSLAYGSTSIVDSPELTTAQFQPGTYFSQVGSSVVMGTLSYGPDASGGSTVWAFSLVNEPNTFPAPTQSTWQTGTPAVNLLSRLATAKISVDPNYSYGLNAQRAPNGICAFPSNGIIAAQQIGEQLTIFSFSASNCAGGGDNPTPMGSVVFTMCADSACSNAP